MRPPLASSGAGPRSCNRLASVKPVIFLDSGGVINDNEARAAQWRMLVAEYFAPRLGGTKSAWAEANRQTLDSLLDPESLEDRYGRADGYASFEREYDRDWLFMMCETVGVQAPQEEVAVALAAEAKRWIWAAVHAPIPGAVGAIRTLRGAGFVLHTASGESSVDLESVLTSLGVRNCFQRLYGPDLVDTPKQGPEYYLRVFADAGVRPGAVLVVDDSTLALGWASQVGARTVLVQKEPPPRWAAASVGALSDLPGWLEAYP